ncbi:ferrochelatase [Phyllobacterium sp. YR620]|uniref:ferrochelatase n=1 Tax=Phyllobacterium sp. YR620 TaxID=1881066 RepID=UPI00088C4F72|nr:ferrochelatase [Phyllobacterium sp. YR620]SDO77981.1 ferrochelatase [Phyllobacterium sp. YR620]
MAISDEARVAVRKPDDHPAIETSKVGVLLVNLGTPDGTDKVSMRRYLAEFLSDKRVIEWPRAIWLPVLYGIVLNTRPKKSGALYDKIWNRERNESPLRTYTRSQSEKLAAALSAHPNVVVDWGMRYGRPSIEEALQRLDRQGCKRIVMFPLYPQYSATTTATVNDKFFEALVKMRFMPATRTVPSYQDEPAYIDALATSIEKHYASLGYEPELLIASYHGIPQSYFKRGDPYPCHCWKTTRLLRERLGWGEDRLITTFQSRFGPEEWMQPYTDKTLEQLAKDGVKSVAVFNPGFVADCLETLEEIAGEGAEIFHHNGGVNFTHVPCLNDSEEGMKVIETLVRRELQGWI